MKRNANAADFLRGLLCAACAALSAAAAFAGNRVIITVIAAAAAFIVCILLLRSPSAASWRRRSLTAVLLYLPLVFGCIALDLHEKLYLLADTAGDGTDTGMLVSLYVFYLPGALFLLAIAALLAAKQEQPLPESAGEPS